MSELQKPSRQKKGSHNILPPEVRRLEKQMFSQGYTVKEILYELKRLGYVISRKTVYNHIKPLKSTNDGDRKETIFWQGDVEWRNFSELDLLGVDRANLRRIRQVEIWLSYGISNLIYPRLTRQNVMWMNYILTYCPDTVMTSFDLWLITEELCRRSMDSYLYGNVLSHPSLSMGLGVEIENVISWIIFAPWLSQRRYIDWIAQGEPLITERLLPIRAAGFILFDVSIVSDWVRSVYGRAAIAHVIYNESHSLELGNLPSRPLKEWGELYDEQSKPDPSLSLHHQPLPPEQPIIRVLNNVTDIDKMPLGLDVREFRYD